MNRLAVCCVVLALSLGSLVPGTGWAAKQNNNKNKNSQNAKKEQHDVQEARDKLQAARRQADAAKEAARKATAAHEKAVDHAGDVRRKIEQEHDANPTLVTARRQMEQSKQTYEDSVAPVLTKLVESASYQSAVAQRNTLKAKLSAVAAGGAPAERDAAGREYQAATEAVRKLEEGAIAADPKAKAAHSAMLESESKVRTLIEQRNKAIDGDSRMAAVKRELEKAKNELEHAKQKLAKELRDVSGAERHLNQQEQEKRAADQRAKQNNNNNKKKK